MTDGQRKALTAMLKGPQVIGTIMAYHLGDYVKKVEGAPSQGRGKAVYEITAAGRKAVTQ